MATYTILGTGSAQTFNAVSGDVFIIDGGLNHNVTINGATDFTVQFNEDLTTAVSSSQDLIRFGQDSEVTVEIAAGVDVANFDIESLRGTSIDMQIGDGATIGGLDLGDVTDAVTITAGDSVTLENGVVGSTKSGADTNYTFGDDLTVTGDLDGGQSSNGSADNNITIGSGANISGNIEMGSGSPISITLGNDVTVGGDIEWGSNSAGGSLTAGTGLTVEGAVLGSGSGDTVIIGDGWDINTNLALGLGNDQLSLGSWAPNTDGVKSISGDSGSDGLRLSPPVGDEAGFEAAATTANWVENTDGTWSPTSSSFSFQYGGYNFSDYGAAVPTTPPLCFTAGTQIEVADGETINVEDLRQGDMVMTADRGLQPVKWIGINTLSGAKLKAQENIRPIRIKAGALGDGLPMQDLIVSPQHRMLVRSNVVEKMVGQSEALVAAKHLVLLDGIDVVTDAEAVTYVHFLCDQHEVVFANGAPSETLYTGPEALKSVSAEALTEIMTLFPELADVNYKALSARFMVGGRKGRQMAVRHKNNRKPLLATMH